MTYRFFFGMAALLSLAACGSTMKMKSERPPDELVIDGKYDDWQGKLTYLEDDEMAVGIHSDTEFLYLCLTTQNRATRRKAMGFGLTVWFDPSGGKEKVLGVRFPLGFSEGRFGGMTPFPDEGDMQERQAPMATELEILSSEKDEPGRFGISEIDGLEVSLGAPRDGFVYELKIPLWKTQGYRYAIEPGDAKLIGVGIETSKPDLERLRAQGGGPGGRQRPPGEMGGPMGGFGGPGGGFGRGGSVGDRAKLFEQFKLWIQVELN